MFEILYLESQKIFPAEIRNFLSGIHYVWRGRTPIPLIQLYSWYFNLLEHVWVLIFCKPEGLSSWISRFCSRRTWCLRRWHTEFIEPTVLLIFRIFNKCLSTNILNARCSFRLIFKILYQMHTRTYEVARRIHRICCIPI